MKFYALVVAGIIVGFSFGYWQKPDTTFEWADIGSSAARMPAADDKTPCPTPEVAADMIKKFKINFNLDHWTCGSDDTRTYFLKALSLAKKFSFTPDKSWDPKFREAVMDLEPWLARYTDSYNIDTQMADTTLAYYRPYVEGKPETNKTYMTERIKQYSPQEVFIIIVHENRHAEAPSLSHTICLSGDFPMGDGACDAEFSDKWAEMGAYNFAALFEIGNVLYNDKLTSAEKDVLAISALTTLSNRLNIIPAKFGYFQETIAFLDEQNGLFLLNPFTLQADPIPFKGNIDHIENAAAATRFSIFSKEGQWSSWDLMKGASANFADILKDRNISDAQRSRVFSQNQILDTYITNGTLEFLDFDSVTKKKKPTAFMLLNSDTMRTDLKRIVFGPNYETVFITQKGDLLRARQYGNEPAFSELKSPANEKWIQGTAGPIYDALYFTSTNGTVSKVAVQYEEEDDSEMKASAYRPPKVTFEPLQEVSKLGPRKYYPGVNGEYVLTQSMNLMYRPYGERDFKTLRTSQKVRDFAIVKNFSLTRAEMRGSLAKQKAFEEKCRVQNSTLNPWTSQPMGIDLSQNLIVADLAGHCQRVAVPGAVLGYRLLNKAQVTKGNEWRPYARPVLAVKTPSGVQLLKPYEY